MMKCVVVKDEPLTFNCDCPVPLGFKPPIHGAHMGESTRALGGIVRSNDLMWVGEGGVRIINQKCVEDFRHGSP